MGPPDLQFLSSLDKLSNFRSNKSTNLNTHTLCSQLGSQHIASPCFTYCLMQNGYRQMVFSCVQVMTDKRRTLTGTHVNSKTVLHPPAFSRCNDGSWTSAESRAFASAGIWDKHGVSNPQEADPCSVHFVFYFTSYYKHTHTHAHTRLQMQYTHTKKHIYIYRYLCNMYVYIYKYLQIIYVCMYAYMLCYAMLCYAMLCYAMLPYPMQCNAMQCKVR